MTTNDIVNLIATLDWKEFDSEDFKSFSGVETDCPMIAYEGDTVYVLDGNQMSVYSSSDEEGEVYFYMKSFFIKTWSHD